MPSSKWTWLCSILMSTLCEALSYWLLVISASRLLFSVRGFSQGENHNIADQTLMVSWFHNYFGPWNEKSWGLSPSIILHSKHISVCACIYSFYPQKPLAFLFFFFFFPNMVLVIGQESVCMTPCNDPGQRVLTKGREWWDRAIVTNGMWCDLLININ